MSMDVLWLTSQSLERHRAEDIKSLLGRSDGFVWVDIPECDQEAEVVRRAGSFSPESEGAMIQFTIYALLIPASMQVAGQTARQNPLLQLQSPEWVVRAEALKQITARSDWLKSEEVKNALVDLLERETLGADEAYHAGDGASERYGEAYSEYYAELLGNVSSFAELDDQRVLKALAEGVYNPDSPFARRLAAYGEAILPTLIELTKSDITPKQWNGLEVLGEMLRLDRAGQTQSKLLQGSVEYAQRTLRSAARSSDSSVRVSAIRALGNAGDRGALPLLRQLAQADPASRKADDGRVIFYVREAAVKAIQMINLQQ